jgi:hypothetical protein
VFRRIALAAAAVLVVSGCQFTGGTAQVTADGTCTEIELPAVAVTAAPTAPTTLPGPILRPCPTSTTPAPTTTPTPTTTTTPPTTTTTAPPAALAPTGLTATVDQAARTVLLQWNPVASATAYRIYEADTPDGLGNTTATSSRRGPLAGNYTYEYWVTAFVGGVESPPSEQVVAVLGNGGTTTTPPPTTTTAPPPPPPGDVQVGSRLVFDGDFDSGNLSQYTNLQTRDRNGSPSGGYCTYSACVRDGGPGHTTAARIEVRDGDIPNFGGGERAELRAPGVADVRPGDERWYQFSLRFDDQFTNPNGDWFIVMQWHAGSGSPPLALEVSRSGVLQFANNRTGARTNIGAIQRGVWVDYVLHVKHATGSGALAEAWVNGAKTATHRHPNMASSSSYLKLGIYRDRDDSGNDTVWHDGLTITAP